MLSFAPPVSRGLGVLSPFSRIYVNNASRVFIDPTSIPDLALWLRADSLSQSDGTAVSSWTDSSGLGRNAVQATGANQPLFKTLIVNSKPIIRFDGSNDFLKVTSLVKGVFTAFYVYKTSTAGTALLGEHSTNSNSAGHYFNPGGAAHFNAAFASASSAWDGSGVTLNNGAFRIVSQRFAGTHATHEGWVNGAAITKGTIYASGSGGIGLVTADYYIGSRAGSSLFYNGDIAEIIIYSSALSTADRQSAEDYLSAKYGIVVTH
jgi:hypothetical protein